MLYVNQREGHNKFWGYETSESYLTTAIPEYTVTYCWGKIGQKLNTNGQIKTYVIKDYMLREIQKRLNYKKLKGYVPLTYPYQTLLDNSPSYIDLDFIKDNLDA